MKVGRIRGWASPFYRRLEKHCSVWTCQPNRVLTQEIFMLSNLRLLRFVALPAVVIAMVNSLSGVADDLKPGVRGLATRAPADMKIDGDLSEFEGAFCTPVNYFFQAEK